MQRHVTHSKLRQIQELASQRIKTSEIARRVGLGTSTVHKARQGCYDHPAKREASATEAGQRRKKVIWCQRCRCHCEGACQLCALRRGKKQPQERRRPPIPLAITDPETIKKLNLPLSQLALSTRTVNRLEDHNILTVNDLLHCTRQELLTIPHVGPQALEQIYGALARLGFKRRSAGAPQAATLPPAEPSG